MTKPINLFSLTFISIITIYLYVLGEDKTIEIIKASAIEALGMTLPGSSAQEAVSDDKRIDCQKAGEKIGRAHV